MYSHQKKSSYTEKSHSALLTAGAGDASQPGGSHDFTYEIALRRISQVGQHTLGWAFSLGSARDMSVVWAAAVGWGASEPDGIALGED